MHGPSTQKGKILIFESCTAIHPISELQTPLLSSISCTAMRCYAPVTNFLFFTLAILCRFITLSSLTYSLDFLLFKTDKGILTLNLLVIQAARKSGCSSRLCWGVFSRNWNRSSLLLGSSSISSSINNNSSFHISCFACLLAHRAFLRCVRTS